MKYVKKPLFSLVFLFVAVLVGIAFAVDSDNDGMSDLYEEFFNLNPTNSVDAAYDYDSDSLTNLTESLLWTDPWVGDTDADGFGDGTDDNPLSRAVIMWGHPDFTTGDTYAYTGPDWWTGAGKTGGTWAAGEYWELPAQEQGELYIDLDRSLLSSNLVLGLLHENSTNSAVYIALEDATGTRVATNIFGDITGDDNTQVLNRYRLLPLQGLHVGGVCTSC